MAKKLIKWVFEDDRITTEDDSNLILYTGDFVEDCPDEVVKNVVDMHNAGKTLLEIDAYLMDEEKITTDDREIIIEAIGKSGHT